MSKLLLVVSHGTKVEVVEDRFMPAGMAMMRYEGGDSWCVIRNGKMISVSNEEANRIYAEALRKVLGET
jgi:hypothetical protein